MLDKETVLKELHAGRCTIEFTKVDGSIRKMKCTLSPALIPPKSTDHETRHKTPNPDIQPVYDLDLGEWRSFRWNSLNKISE